MCYVRINTHLKDHTKKILFLKSFLKLLILISFLFPTIIFSQIPTFNWVKPSNSGTNIMADGLNNIYLIGGSVSKYDENINLITTVSAYDFTMDNAGNYYTLLKSTNDSLTIHKFDYSDNNIYTVGIKLDQGFSWADDINQIAVDNANNLFVLTSTRANGSPGNLYLFKYDPDGILLWEKQIGEESAFLYIPDLLINNNGDVVICGNFGYGTIKFGHIVLGPYSSTYYMFICKLSNDGVLQNAIRFSPGHIYSFNIDNTDNIYITGESRSANNQPWQVFLKKYNSSGGSLLWSKDPSSNNTSKGKDVKVCDDKVYIVGSFYDALDFGGGFTLNSSGAFLAAYDLDGVILDAKGVPTGYFEGITSAEDNVLYVCGQVDDPDMYFGNFLYPNSGSFIAKLDLSVSISQFKFYNQVIPNYSNQENYINTGLPIRFKTKVFNELTQNLSTLQGTLTSSTPGVTITDGSVGFSNLGSGLSAWCNGEFEIVVDESVAAGTLLEFTLSCNDQIVGGGPWESVFSFPIAPLENGVIVLLDANNGDGDGIPEPGETLELVPTLNNVSNNSLAMVNGVLSSEQSFIIITSDNWNYNLVSNVQTPIEPDDINIQPEYAYIYNYPGNSPFRELNFDLQVSANLNDINGPLLKWKTNFLFNEGIGVPPIIVSVSPIDDAVEIDVSTNFEIVFDQNITAVSGKYIFIYKSGGSIYSTIEATATQVSITNNIVTINPSYNLVGGTGFYIIIDNGAFKDESDIAFTGISSPNIWNFLTVVQDDPPEIPTNVDATAISNSKIEVRWDAVSLADTYQVLSCNESVTYTTSATSTSFVVSGLGGSTTYDFTVKAENSAGLSDASDCVSETTFCVDTWGDAIIYSNSTVAYGIVTIEGSPASEYDIVGVFVGDECRSISEVVINQGTAYVTLSIQGESVESLTFKVWDNSECTELNVDLAVQSNPGGNLGYPPNFLQIAAEAGAITENLTIQNKTITNGQTNCFNATGTITIAGSGTTVDIQSGGEATFIAGETIYLKAGFHSHSGSLTHAYITTTGDYCSSQQSMVANPYIVSDLPELIADDDPNIKIYPNPTTGNFTIDFVGKETSAEIVLLNFQGQQLLIQQCKEQLSKDIDISYLPGGMYIVVIKTNEKIVTRKIIKHY